MAASPLFVDHLLDSLHWAYSPISSLFFSHPLTNEFAADLLTAEFGADKVDGWADRVVDLALKIYGAVSRKEQEADARYHAALKILKYSQIFFTATGIGSLTNHSHRIHCVLDLLLDAVESAEENKDKIELAVSLWEAYRMQFPTRRLLEFMGTYERIPDTPFYDWPRVYPGKLWNGKFVVAAHATGPDVETRGLLRVVHPNDLMGILTGGGNPPRSLAQWIKLAGSTLGITTQTWRAIFFAYSTEAICMDRDYITDPTTLMNFLRAVPLERLRDVHISKDALPPTVLDQQHGERLVKAQTLAQCFFRSPGSIVSILNYDSIKTWYAGVADLLARRTLDEYGHLFD